MSGIRRILFFVSLTASALFAQAAPGTIQATGSATLSVKPDQMVLDVSVITQATTAAQAAQQNATLTTSVIAALQQVLGSSGSIQTVSYSLTPRYSTTPGQMSQIVGFNAQNTVRTTSYDLTLAGPLIDAANQAGANSIGGLSFGLQDPGPSLLQALSQAAKQAQAHAAAIAGGLGAKAGAVLSAVEGSSVAPVLVGVAAGGSGTPVITGTVTVSASVTVTVQLQ